MATALTHQRIREDKARAAAMFNVPVSSLREFSPSISRGLSTIAIHCRHQADVETGRALRNWTVIPEILLDEHGTCYALAGQCICGKVYYIRPTVELLDLAESLARQSRPQIRK